MPKPLIELSALVDEDRMRLHRRKCMVCRSKEFMANIAAFKRARTKDPAKWGRVTAPQLLVWAEAAKHGVLYSAFRKHLLVVDPGFWSGFGA